MLQLRLSYIYLYLLFAIILDRCPVTGQVEAGTTCILLKKKKRPVSLPILPGLDSPQHGPEPDGTLAGNDAWAMSHLGQGLQISSPRSTLHSVRRVNACAREIWRWPPTATAGRAAAVYWHDRPRAYVLRRGLDGDGHEARSLRRCRPTS